MSSSLAALDPVMLGDVPVQGPPKIIEDSASQWPRMLELPEDVMDRLERYLDYEIDLIWQEKEVVVQDWIQWNKDYWAKPASKVKNFPFRRSANIVIPMTAIAVEAIFARLLTTLFSIKPFFSIRPRLKEWIEAAPDVESWLQSEVEDFNSLDMDGFARESLLELIKLGTGVGKSGYERDLGKVNVDMPDGGSIPKWVEKKNGATLDYVPLANFLMRFHEKDPQTAAIVGEDHNDVTWVTLKKFALGGRMRPEAIEEIKSWWAQDNNVESPSQKVDDARRANENAEPNWKETFNFTELWLLFDVDGDGVDEEIVVDFHKPSRTILSIRYNWYDDLHRPYRIGVYIPVEGRWMGIGVGKQNEQFQALITTIHRQRLDAGTLANMGQLALKKSSGYGPDEPIWPGKMWFVDNPSTDIREFSLSNTQHFAQLSNEDSARSYADKRTGANESILGFPTQRTPPTASSDAMKLIEGNKKFDMILKNVRRWYGLLGHDALANYQQFGSRGRSWLVRGEGGIWIEKLLTMPQADIRRGAVVELTVTDSITNKEVEQTKWLQLFGVLSAHYDKALERAGQVAGLLGDPQVFLLFAQMALRSSNAAMRRLFEAFGEPDIDAFLLDLEGAQDAQPGTTSITPPGSAQGGERAIGPAGGVEPAQADGTPGGGVVEGSGVSIERF